MAICAGTLATSQVLRDFKKRLKDILANDILYLKHVIISMDYCFLNNEKFFVI